LDSEHEKLRHLKTIAKGNNSEKDEIKKTDDDTDHKLARKKARLNENKEITKTIESSLSLQPKHNKPQVDLNPVTETRQSNILKKKNLLVELQEKKAIVAEIKKSDPAKASDMAWELMAKSTRRYLI